MRLELNKLQFVSELFFSEAEFGVNEQRFLQRFQRQKSEKQAGARGEGQTINTSSPVCSPSDSESTAVSLSALLASLNSCCNPWIYMLFSGQLLSDCARSLPCCRLLRRRFTRRHSDCSSRRTTLLSRLQGPTSV